MGGCKFCGKLSDDCISIFYLIHFKVINLSTQSLYYLFSALFVTYFMLLFILNIVIRMIISLLIEEASKLDTEES